MAILDDLIQTVERSASLSPAQASAAVACVLRFLAARLPSPLFGELQSHLNAPAAPGPAGPAAGRTP